MTGKTFLDFPIELRQIIYKLAFGSTRTIITRLCGCDKCFNKKCPNRHSPKGATGVLLASKVIHADFAAWYYPHHSFVIGDGPFFSDQASHDAMRNFLKFVPKLYIESITKLEIASYCGGQTNSYNFEVLRRLARGALRRFPNLQNLRFDSEWDYGNAGSPHQGPQRICHPIIDIWYRLIQHPTLKEISTPVEYDPLAWKTAWASLEDKMGFKKHWKMALWEAEDDAVDYLGYEVILTRQ